MRTIYLCGPINGRSDSEVIDWRQKASALLKTKFRMLDPSRNDYRGREMQNAAKIVAQDTADISQSDYLLVWFDQPSVGTAMEIRMAFAEMSKSVFVVDRSSKPLSPWLIRHCTKVFSTLESACDYLNTLEGTHND
jgi:nucleoside 2-deoxyribosyltransferase